MFRVCTHGWTVVVDLSDWLARSGIFTPQGTLAAAWTPRTPNGTQAREASGLPCSSSDPNQHSWKYVWLANRGHSFVISAPAPHTHTCTRTHAQLHVHSLAHNNPPSYDSAKKAVTFNKTKCLDYSNANQLTVEDCGASINQEFTYTASQTLQTKAGGCLDIWNWAGPRVDIFACNKGSNQNFTFGADGTMMSGSSPSHPTRCLASVPPSETGDLQLWAKPLPDVSCCRPLLHLSTKQL